MTKTRCPGLRLLIASLVVACLIPVALAQVSGRMKIQRTDGKWVTGEVEETPDAYIVKVSKSITITIRKTEVKAILPADEPTSQPGKGQEDEGESENPERGVLRDADIEALLAGTDAEPPPSELSLEEGELPMNEESVEEMKRIIGADDVVTTKHAVVVYTGAKKDAMEIARRLEAIWRWNVRYMRMVNLPVHIPEHKLELYYVATRQEFDALCVNVGGPSMGGVLGFFTPVTNRSHFYNMLSEPAVKARLERAKKAPAAVQTREENLAKQWAEYETMEVTQHELGHHIHFNIGLFPRYEYLEMVNLQAKATWLVEGTTMQFEVPPGAEGGSLGAFNHSRLSQFRRLYPKFPPEWMNRFLIDNRVWYGGGGVFYPLGWALVYYMREEKPEGLAKYYHIIATREPGDTISYSQRTKEIEECFGKIDQKWMDDFWNFMKGLQLKRSLLPPENYP